MAKLKTHLLFVYGTLKKGYGNNRLMAVGRSSLVGSAKTVQPYRLMDFGGFPGMYQNHTAASGVTGELWEVDDVVLSSCDRLEGHPSFYRRTPIEVVCGGKRIDCETYFYQHDLHGSPCLDGVWPRGKNHE